MESLTARPGWQEAVGFRKIQRVAGLCSGVLLACALLALFDGLLAQMRAGSNQVDLVIGESLIISGPVPVKNPLPGDLKLRCQPDNALEFKFDGFYTGYWFGNGMWKGSLSAAKDALPGNYELTISFRGASAQTRQNFNVALFADDSAKRSASLSLIQKLGAMNPFILAAWLGGAGILTGLVTYLAGTRFTRLCRQMLLLEVYRLESASGDFACLYRNTRKLSQAQTYPVFNDRGIYMGDSTFTGLQKGDALFRCAPGLRIRPGYIVDARQTIL